MCPCCQTIGNFTRHGQYEKYWFQECIGILRVRCAVCGKTHAVIPSFSVPNGSYGMEETEHYLLERSRGVGRKKAFQELLECGAAESYPRFLESKVAVAVVRAKALFPDLGTAVLHGFAWVLSCFAVSAGGVLQQVNRYGLARRTNPVFFSRANILCYEHPKAGSGISHNHDTVAGAAEVLDYPP